jgi:hypothetical protein
MIIYWHWEAMLVSYLANRVIVLPFNSLAELSQTSGYRMYLSPGSAEEDSFKLATDPIWQKMWTEKILPYMDEFNANRGLKKK